MKVTDIGYYMDGYLEQNLSTAKSVVKKDWDMVFCVDGPERSGKSTIAQQMAYFCDSTFNLDRITFTPEEFKKCILSAEPYQSVIYDEAFTGLSSRAAMSQVNRTLTSMMAEIGQKNLFVFVVMPTFFDLDKYVAIWRSRGLIHVYTGDNFARGFFAFYNTDRKKELYINGKKFYSYKLPKPNFTGRFTGAYVVDDAAYRKKKKGALTDREKVKADKEIKQKVEDSLFVRLAELQEKVPHTVKMKILGMPQSTYFWKLKRYEDRKEYE